MKVLAAIGIAVISALIVLGVYVSYSNAEIALRNRGAAQQKAVEAVFDNTWKILKQQAGVADKYKDSFKDIYAGIMGERYGQDKQLLVKFVTESNPQFDSGLFAKLMNSIEAQRTVFTTEQKVLIDIKMQHDNLIQMFPGSVLLASREPLKITIITSTRAKEASESGLDDDVSL